MEGCCEKESGVPVVTFPEERDFWKGYAQYVKDNIGLKALHRVLRKPAIRDFILMGSDGYMYACVSRGRLGGFEVIIRKTDSDLLAHAVLLPTEDGAVFRIYSMENAPACRELRHGIELAAFGDICVMLHTAHCLPGLLNVTERGNG